MQGLQPQPGVGPAAAAGAAAAAARLGLIRQGEEPEAAGRARHVIGGARVEPPVRLPRREGALGVHRAEPRPGVAAGGDRYISVIFRAIQSRCKGH